MPTCRGTTRDGWLCAYRVRPGREFCGFHEPGRSINSVVCRHPRRVEIEVLLAAGLRNPDVARSFRLASDAVRYHRGHLPPVGAEGAGGALRSDGGPNDG